jgi:hypothetical protein
MIVRRVYQDEALFLPGANEVFYGLKVRLGRTAKQKISFVIFSKIINKFVARTSSIEDQDGSGRNTSQKSFGRFPLRTIYNHYASGHREASEDIISRLDQTLGIMAFAFMLKATLGIEFSAKGLQDFQWVAGYKSRPPNWNRMAIRKRSLFLKAQAPFHR